MDPKGKRKANMHSQGYIGLLIGQRQEETLREVQVWRVAQKTQGNHLSHSGLGRAGSDLSGTLSLPRW
jgi:hypothetical protein